MAQARLLGMPGARMLYIPHPVQLLTHDELSGRADAVFGDVLAALTTGPETLASPDAQTPGPEPA